MQVFKRRVLYRISGKERQKLEELRQAMVVASASYNALLRDIMQREGVPEGSVLDQSRMVFLRAPTVPLPPPPAPRIPAPAAEGGNGGVATAG